MIQIPEKVTNELSEQEVLFAKIDYVMFKLNRVPKELRIKLYEFKLNDTLKFGEIVEALLISNKLVEQYKNKEQFYQAGINVFEKQQLTPLEVERNKKIRAEVNEVMDKGLIFKDGKDIIK